MMRGICVELLKSRLNDCRGGTSKGITKWGMQLIEGGLPLIDLVDLAE